MGKSSYLHIYVVCMCYNHVFSSPPTIFWSLFGYKSSNSIWDNEVFQVKEPKPNHHPSWGRGGKWLIFAFKGHSLKKSICLNFIIIKIQWLNLPHSLTTLLNREKIINKKYVWECALGSYHSNVFFLF